MINCMQPSGFTRQEQIGDQPSVDWRMAGFSTGNQKSQPFQSIRW